MTKRQASDSRFQAKAKPNVALEHHCSLLSQLRPSALGAVFVKLKQQMPPRLGVMLNFVH